MTMKSFFFRPTCFAALLIAQPLVAAPPKPTPHPTPRPAAPGQGPTERAPSYEAALARAKATGMDIAVYQYGSDWNPCSLSLFQRVWSPDLLPRALGPGFVLVAIDQPEVVGGRAVYGRCTAEKCGLVGYSDTPIGNSAPLRFESLAKAEPPPTEVVSVTTPSGAIFNQREDGTFVASKVAPNPAQDTVILTMKSGSEGSVLRLDFPLDDSLPAGGPGRAPNGNAVISEIEVEQFKKSLKPEHAWGSVNMGNNFGPWMAVDGNKASKDEGWNVHGGQQKRRTLFVALGTPARAGSELTVRLINSSQWGQHSPGAVRACVLPDPELLANLRAIGAAQQAQYRNRGFTFAGWGKMPRLSLLDSQGRPVAANPNLDIRMSSMDFANELLVMRARRQKRDALWAHAEKAQGVAKAELLRQGLDAMNLGRDPEFGRDNGWGGGTGPYTAIHQAISAADPKDESGAKRWLGFSQGAWGKVAWAPENQWWKKLEGKPAPSDMDYAEAEACIDRELTDPRNKLLETDHLQHIMKARYDLYLRKFKGDHTQAKLFEIQRQIAKVDPNSFWGVGAIGYLGMYRRSDQPFVAYGFDAKHQAKPGKNAWVLADAWQDVDHAGPYRLKITCQNGKSSLKFTRIAVVMNGREIGVGKPEAGNDVLGPGAGAIAIPFECGPLPRDAKCALRLEYEGSKDPLELIGAFSIEPLLIEG